MDDTHRMNDLIEIVSELITEAIEVLSLAENEHKYMLSMAPYAKHVNTGDAVHPSDWIGFRKKYEQWYRACIGVITDYHFSGLDDFKELYSGNNDTLPTISKALLTGFSSENYFGFRDRMENQLAIIESLSHEVGKKRTVKTELSTLIEHDMYVNTLRIEEIRAVTTTNFDLTKLVELCNELNRCYANQCFLAVTMLVRAILDHVPPIFGYKTFTEFTNNYGGTKSFKQSMDHLENSLRKIADAHLHGQIRKRESLPNKTQVNFSADLDVLLSEIVRVLK